MAKTVTLVLTAAQARLVNTALAREEAEDWDADSGYTKANMERTRRAVWDAMAAAGVEP